MTIDEQLRRAAAWAALLVCALAVVALGSAIGGLDPLRHLRIEAAPMAPNAALALLLTGASLWLQHRGQFPRAGLACALVAGGLCLAIAAENVLRGDLHLDHLLGRATAAAPDQRMSLPTCLALGLGALAVALLGQRRHRARWPLSTWLANLLIALSVAALVALVFRTVSEHAWPLRLGSHLSLALLLLGAGTLVARPEDRMVTMLFAPGPSGVLTRRLYFGAAIVPVMLSVILLTSVQVGVLGLADGMVLLCLALILSGFAIALVSAGAAVAISERRDEAEQARLLLTARLQEQAAQLQETVSLRTRELSEANTSLRAAGKSNALLALVAEHTTNGVLIADAAGRVEWLNAAFTRITGYGLADVKGRAPSDVLQGPGSDPATLEKMRAALRQAKPCHVEVLNSTKDGHPFWISLDLQPVHDRHGTLVNFIALVVDITDERAAQQRLHNLNDRLALATRAAAIGVWEWDAATRRSQWDARTLEIYGLTADSYAGTNDDWLARLHPEDRERMLAAYCDLANASPGFEHDFRIVRANDGAVRHIESRGVVQRDAAGRLVRVTGTERDVTAERDAAHQSAMLNERLRLALRSSNYGVWELDVATKRILWDERMLELYGVARAGFDGSHGAWSALLHPDDRERAFAFAGKVISGEEPTYHLEFRVVRPDGAVRHIEAHGYLQRDAHNLPVRLVGLNRDITARKQLEDRVRKSEELAADVSSIAQIGGWEYNVPSGRFTWTDGVRRIHEVDDDFQPTLATTRNFYPPEALATLQAALETRDRQASIFDHELPLVTAAGRHRWVRWLGRADFREDGQPVRVHGAVQDITVRHESETARRELETQLFQAQKMETLGTLAGGIAHDFNNLLTGIIGYHELAADSVPGDHPARACLNEARGASLRARELVEQILTFGRQSPGGGQVPLDLGPIAEEARRFLRSTLPAMITIELRVAPDCPPVLGDATQIHQVLLNLGSNAAHAMRHHGGTLAIDIGPAPLGAEAAHLPGGSAAGRHMRIAVTDTGHGMDEATRRRIFDPFFTTKNPQEGTGLGLAVVHGIVRAHRGAIDVASQPGAGAAFTVYLPVATPDGDHPGLEPTEAPRGAGEIICGVDDEEGVGSCTKTVLERKGYHVLVFRSAEECLAAIGGRPGSCSLLVTDQTMPGMQGTELIGAIRQGDPGLPVVIMSGYFPKISAEQLDEIGQIELLAKPFTTEELAASIHRALHPVPAPG